MIIESKVRPVGPTPGDGIPNGAAFYGRINFYPAGPEDAPVLYLRAHRTFVDLGNPTRTFHVGPTAPWPDFVDVRLVSAKVVVE